MTSAKPVRAKIRRQRLALDQSNRDYSARLACKRLTRLHCFRNSRTIALYLPVGGELDPLPVLAKANDMGKTCLLPVLHPLQSRLWFSPWKPGDALASNRFGIAEPKWLRGNLIANWSIDLVITPLVAFDSSGTRLGMGGGYYDRSFAYLKRRQHLYKPLLVGYGYTFQHLETLTRNPWDVPLDLAITDSQVYTFAD